MRQLYSRFFNLLPVSRIDVDDRLYLLDESELAAIRRRERIAVWLSAAAGALGVILLYVPFYLFPGLFPTTTVNLMGRTFDLPLVFWVYSALLVAVEIVFLAFLNIWCAHQVAVATGFLNHRNKDVPEKKNLLLDIGLEKKDKRVLTYGIDPLLGLNRKWLLLWNLFFILKATLTNVIFRFLVQRVLGRQLIKAVQDFIGIPIFAFWNAFGTRTILRETRVVIMGQNLIEEFLAKVEKDGRWRSGDRELISDTLQFIAVSKRDFHQNHYLLTRNLFELMGISAREGEWQEDGFLERLQAAYPEDRRRALNLILLGFILDGRISRREKSRIRSLHESGLIPFDGERMEAFARNFMDGRGVEGLLYPSPQA
jgi:hypothetical protein